MHIFEIDKKVICNFDSFSQNENNQIGFAFRFNFVGSSKILNFRDDFGHGQTSDTRVRSSLLPTRDPRTKADDNCDKIS